MRLLAVFLLVFITFAPANPAGADEVRIAVISDLNERYGSSRYHPRVHKAVQRIIELQPDIVISTGDMISGQRVFPLLSREKLERMWQSFHEHVTDPLLSSGLPLAVTPGNHDASVAPRYSTERDVYREVWLRYEPAVEFLDRANYPFNYAFGVKDVLFISLDATRPGPLSHRQKDWLRILLDTHGAQFRRRVLFSHLPIWPFTQETSPEILADRELQAIIEAGNVDLYLSGHHHAFYPGFMNGTHYVSQGCLGASPRHLLGDSQRAPRSISLIQIGDDDSVKVAAFYGPDFRARLDAEGLPERIRFRDIELVRQPASTPALTR